MENWKPVLGYEGLYEVSDQGRVRSVETIVKSSCRNGGTRIRPSKILRAAKKSNGYLSVDLGRDGKIKTRAVHRIVAEAFLPAEPGKTQVNHKNLNKLDNRPVNLEWCTPGENIRHAHENGACAPSPHRKRLRCRETGREFDSSYQAALWVNEKHKQFSGNIPSMSRSIRGAATGRSKSAFGYHWDDVIEESSTTIPSGSTPKRVEMGDPS